GPGWSGGGVTVTIEAKDMCRRYTALVIRGVTVKPSPEKIAARLEAVGLRPINNVVDATNYVMLALGHPLHAFDLDRLHGPAIVVRRGKPGESMRSLDGEMRKLDENTCVIADAERAVGLGGIIGGAESEITAATKNVLLECAWFEPSVIRRTARRLGIKTDASYRFERRVDPNDTLLAVQLTAEMIGGAAEAPIDVVAVETPTKTLRLRESKLHDQSGGAVGIGYALELFRRLGFAAAAVHDGIRVDVPTYRGDIHEEMDLVEEVLRFFGLNNVPGAMPRSTTGDVRRQRVDIVSDEVRDVLAGCGLSETISYSFIHPEHNAIFSAETPISITNALTESLSSMRLSLLPGLLENVVFNRSYGNRDGALFEVARTYHRSGEHMRAALVMYGTLGEFWGDAKRPVDFFDVKGVVEQIAARLHVALEFAAGDQPWLRKGKRAIARHGEREIASVGFIAPEVLQTFGIKGDVAAAEIDIEALIAATGAWTMSPVARYPGVPMILALTHGRDLAYQRIVDTIRSFNVPNLYEVGLRDRFVPEGEETIKTTLGMWYQAFDRSLTQEEVSALQQQLASRLADMLPVKLL
ncbi:MAG TPA: phenylalanine--tRNA ligase subunit beta, partial [Thermoanaerobaculia bacterium]|nr:phenylalanine--tRNA ligase subunit beta [Thermoanaerobaculia bacterium]